MNYKKIFKVIIIFCACFILRSNSKIELEQEFIVTAKKELFEFLINKKDPDTANLKSKSLTQLKVVKPKKVLPLSKIENNGVKFTLCTRTPIRQIGPHAFLVSVSKSKELIVTPTWLLVFSPGVQWDIINSELETKGQAQVIIEKKLNDHFLQKIKMETFSSCNFFNNEPIKNSFSLSCFCFDNLEIKVTKKTQQPLNLLFTIYN